MIATEPLIKLLTLAEETLANSPKTHMSQAIVFLTQAGNTYCFYTPLDNYSATEDQIVAILAEKNDTAINSLVAMWENGSIDIVSHSLRKKLIALNESNQNAWMFLRGDSGYTVCTINSTMT